MLRNESIMSVGDPVEVVVERLSSLVSSVLEDGARLDFRPGHSRYAMPSPGGERLNRTASVLTTSESGDLHNRSHMEPLLQLEEALTSLQSRLTHHSEFSSQERAENLALHTRAAALEAALYESQATVAILTQQLAAQAGASTATPPQVPSVSAAAEMQASAVTEHLKAVMQDRQDQLISHHKKLSESLGKMVEDCSLEQREQLQMQVSMIQEKTHEVAAAAARDTEEHVAKVQSMLHEGMSQLVERQAVLERALAAQEEQLRAMNLQSQLHFPTHTQDHRVSQERWGGPPCVRSPVHPSRVISSNRDDEAAYSCKDSNPDKSECGTPSVPFSTPHWSRSSIQRPPALGPLSSAWQPAMISASSSGLPSRTSASVRVLSPRLEPAPLGSPILTHRTSPQRHASVRGTASVLSPVRGHGQMAMQLDGVGSGASPTLPFRRGLERVASPTYRRSVLYRSPSPRGAPVPYLVVWTQSSGVDFRSSPELSSKIAPNADYAPAGSTVLAAEIRGDWLRTTENKWLPIKLPSHGVLLEPAPQGSMVRRETSR
mmetsp:Transcript_9475/g.20874  ORF Transcript_9475/g.20874 Transcript_9475/m.20874 type:complete len:546 (+) Transcript_9475:38-1675(+)